MDERKRIACPIPACTGPVRWAIVVDGHRDETQYACDPHGGEIAVNTARATGKAVQLVDVIDPPVDRPVEWTPWRDQFQHDLGTIWGLRLVNFCQAGAKATNREGGTMELKTIANLATLLDRAERILLPGAYLAEDLAP